MKRLRQQALRCIVADSQLARHFELLLSISGVGENSAIQMLGEISLLPPDRDVRQWVTYAGLDPRENPRELRPQARAHQQSRNRHLRRALYMPFLVASRLKPHLRGFYLHLLHRGKNKRQALTAVARKLLHAIYGMFRGNQRFDGVRAFSPVSLQQTS